MRDRILKEALRLKAVERKRAEEEKAAAREAVLSLPDVAAARRKYVGAFYATARSRSREATELAETLREEYVSALARHGYSEEDFEPDGACPHCNDTGIVDGSPCKCVRDVFVRLLEKECGISATGYCLDDFDATRLPATRQSELLGSVYALMRSYVGKFPAIGKNIVLLTGATGTGKTMLAEAMARQMIRRGYAALFLSATELNKLMVKAHTSRYPECDSVLDDVLSADMLVIDDLGTEPRYRNVTCEYLLTILEERTRRKLSTVITTNISVERILNTYNERIFSRLGDRRTALVLDFEGEDLRAFSPENR